MVVCGESVYYCGEEVCPLDRPSNVYYVIRTAEQLLHTNWKQKILEHCDKKGVRENVFVPNEA